MSTIEQPDPSKLLLEQEHMRSVELDLNYRAAPKLRPASRVFDLRFSWPRYSSTRRGALYFHTSHMFLYWCHFSRKTTGLLRAFKKAGQAYQHAWPATPSWSQRQESNPQPSDYKSLALPLSHAGTLGAIARSFYRILKASVAGKRPPEASPVFTAQSKRNVSPS